MSRNKKYSFFSFSNQDFFFLKHDIHFIKTRNILLCFSDQHFFSQNKTKYLKTSKWNHKTRKYILTSSCDFAVNTFKIVNRSPSRSQSPFLNYFWSCLLNFYTLFKTEFVSKIAQTRPYIASVIELFFYSDLFLS